MRVLGFASHTSEGLYASTDRADLLCHCMLYPLYSQMFCTAADSQPRVDTFVRFVGVLVETLGRLHRSAGVAPEVSSEIIRYTQRTMDTVWVTLEEWMFLLKEDAVSVVPAAALTASLYGDTATATPSTKEACLDIEA